MKILVICQYYYPEPFRINDVCEALVSKGHEVTVITGTPNYPMGEIYEGYGNGQRAREVINGVDVIRCSIHPRKKGAVNRLWNYYSFVNASKRKIKQVDDDFDVVLIYQLSPVMMAEAGILYAKRHHIKSVLYCLDLWPASLSAGGISGGVIYSWFAKESKRIYQAVDKILVSSESFSVYFLTQFGIKEPQYLPQYAENIFSVEDCRKKPDESIDLMFAGNVGTAQSVETIIKAASLCKDISNLRCHIVGDGIALRDCEELAKRLNAPVVFYGRKPVSDMPHYYAKADAMLVTMKKDPTVSLTLPGKLQSYMAAGKPIIGAIDGEANSVITSSKCGYCCSAEDAEGLSDCVRKFVNDKNKKQLADNAINYYRDFFSKDMFINQLESELEKTKKDNN